MGLWDKVKDAAQKAAEAAKDQVNREDSLLNKTVDATRRAADKATVVAKDQVHRQDSVLNRVKDRAAATSDKILGKIDALDAGHDDQMAAARRYSQKKRAVAMAGIEEMEVEEAPSRAEDQPRFPNSEGLTDEEIYRKVSETIYPDFRTLPTGDKKWALCRIARYDKRMVNLMRALGSAYIDTLRQLAENDEAVRAALEAAGLVGDPEVKTAFRNWVDDAYDDEFYADDDGGHAKSVRLIGWLVFQRVGGAAGEQGGFVLERAFQDAGARDVYGVARRLAAARTVLDAREAVVLEAFKPRRASFESRFLVQKGINAEVGFVWLGTDGRPDGTDDLAGPGRDDDPGFSGGSLMEL